MQEPIRFRVGLNPSLIYSLDLILSIHPSANEIDSLDVGHLELRATIGVYTL